MGRKNKSGTASVIHFIRNVWIRDVTAKPNYKVFAVISKHYTDDTYSHIAKLNKSIDLKECQFAEKI